MIPYSRQSIDNRDIKVTKILKSLFTNGPKSLEFEN